MATEMKQYAKRQIGSFTPATKETSWARLARPYATTSRLNSAPTREGRDHPFRRPLHGSISLAPD